MQTQTYNDQIMKQKEITAEDISQILNEKLGIEFWEFQLGVGLQYEYVTGNIKFSAPYPEMGKKLWKAFKFELYELLCDRKLKIPNNWLNELISGDIRNLVVGISSAITAKYEVTLGIAIPLSALIIKSNVLTYCSDAPKKPKRSVTEILKDKKSKNKK